MIILLHGADTYRSKRALDVLIARFREETGEGADRIDVREARDRVRDIGRTASLFAAKACIVLEGVFDAEDIALIKKRIPGWLKDTDRSFILYERRKIPASDALLKALQKQSAHIEEFEAMTPARALRWLEEEMARTSTRIAERDMRTLIERFGADIWALVNEATKVADGWPLVRDVSRDVAIWDFTDAFFTNRRASVRLLTHMLHEGEEPIAILGALAGSLRSLALVWYGIETKNLGAAVGKMHPFVARKQEVIARKVDRAAIERAFRWFARADRELKSGASPAPLPLIKLVLR